jgi:hypothetical protein
VQQPYYPQYQMPRPAYYYGQPAQPQPMYSYTPATPPKLNTFGPVPVDASTAPATTTGSRSPAPGQPANGVVRTNAAQTDVALEGCGPEGCPTGACTDDCGVCKKMLPLPLPPPNPSGHFIGIVGLEFLVPFPAQRTAYTTSTPTSSSTTSFAHDLDYAPFFSLGYVFHNGWGIRGDFWFMHGNSNALVGNSNPNVSIATPPSTDPAITGQPFQIVTPSTTLLAGIGTDQFTFSRSFDFKVADLEVVREYNLFDSFFLFGAGARYAMISQGYSATRTNGGGTNPATGTIVTLDQENLSFLSRYEGMGPTVSFEMVHPIHGTCLSLYGNVRGSWLFGTERFHEDYLLSNASIVGGVSQVVNTVFLNENAANRTVPVLDLEAGIQAGWRCGPCYVFGRVGAVYSHWWDIGSSYGSTGSLDLVGGTVKVGIIY